MVIASIGTRTYEFKSSSDVAAAREIYVNCKGDQDTFERKMESKDIKFVYDYS